MSSASAAGERVDAGKSGSARSETYADMRARHREEVRELLEKHREERKEYGPMEDDE